MAKILWVVAAMAGCAAGCASALQVTHLRCDARENPVGVDARRPELAWVNQSQRRGEKQGAYRVLVSSSPQRRGDVWDSGKVASDRDSGVEYGGPKLEPGREYWWTVRTWDQNGSASNWSDAARWVQGPTGDWKGEWIAARTASPLKGGTPNGYHALEAKDANEAKWVQVDLGREVAVESVVLFPAEPNNYKPRTKGFGFPVRFKIEGSATADFGSPVVIADETGRDYPNPSSGEGQEFSGKGVRARYVRVTGVKNWVRKDGVACFALGEVRVKVNGENVAEGRVVAAKDSVEAAGWGVAGLTDGFVPPGVANEYAAPLLRKDFVVGKKVVRATATICGLGYYELYLNGTKVGDHVLDPGFTAFDKRAMYAMYDVTGQVKIGGNAVGVMLGGGWYELATPDLFGDEHALWTAPPKVKMQLDVETEGGGHEVVVTDGSWKWSTGEIVFQCLRAGETHDMRLAKPGWSNAGYDDGAWTPVNIVQGPGGGIVAQRQPAIKVAGEIPVVEVTEPRRGVYVYKLAENTAGWARFKASGEAGRKITLHFGETLNKSGQVATFLGSHTYGRWQTGEMILAGKGVETFEPRFCYHGFQYVQVEGCATKPGKDDLVGVKVHTALEPAGTFECSNDLINKSHEMILRTYLANLHSIPTDCPQREKMGWMCDGMVASRQAMLNFDAHNLYEKWTGDMEDAQAGDGSMPSIVPTQGWSEVGHPGEDFQCPWWGGATVVVPWNLYEAYGDVGILRSHYPAMKRYVDSITAKSKDGIVTWGLGDWLEVGINGRPVRTPTELTSTAGYAYFARLVSETAGLLGNREDAEKYAKLAEEVRGAFNKKYLRDDGRYGDDTLAAPALALVLRLAPDDKRDLIGQRLIENIEQNRHNHLSTGLVGTRYLFMALEEMGREDVAFRVATAGDFPSWSNMMKNGATTLWESWDGSGSRNHPALGAPDAWFYSGLAGIRPAKPGYKEIVIKPAVVGDLTWVKAKYESVHGLIQCDWRKAGDFAMDITIPANTTAVVYVPASSAEGVREGGRLASDAEGVRFVGMEGGFAKYAVGSGHYSFAAK